MTKAVLERALGEDMSQHLGYDKHDPAGRGSGNSRNGSSGKRLLIDIGGIDLDVPRDRNGSFASQIVRKGQTRLDGFNDRIIALYARGLSTRDIRAHLREMYDVEVSPDLISRVTADTSHSSWSPTARRLSTSQHSCPRESENSAVSCSLLKLRSWTTAGG